MHGLGFTLRVLRAHVDNDDAEFRYGLGFRV